MSKVIVYYGPREAFETYIRDIENYKNFIDLIYIHDSYKNELFKINLDSGEIEKEIKISVKNVVAFSDEYSLISEGATNAFSSLLNSFLFECLILQNPPLYIFKQLEKKYGEIKPIYYEYTKFDSSKLKEIDQLYDQKIIGQKMAKTKLMRTILSNTELSLNHKPTVIMFYGPSGVGKTETAKMLSEILGQELFREQFSMFQSNEFGAFLFGDVHYKNSFAKELLERKSNIILLDEFDKCPSNVYSAFYQLFDEGIFMDKNYKVYLKDTIIICTSNFLSVDDIKKHVGDPIFYRFDATIEFKSLNIEETKEIIKMRYREYVSTLTEEQRKILNNIEAEEKLLTLAKYFKNFRDIDIYIKDFISGVLLPTYLK